MASRRIKTTGCVLLQKQETKLTSRNFWWQLVWESEYMLLYSSQCLPTLLPTFQTTSYRQHTDSISQLTCTTVWWGHKHFVETFLGTQSYPCPSEWCCTFSWDLSLEKEGCRQRQCHRWLACYATETRLSLMPVMPILSVSRLRLQRKWEHQLTCLSRAQTLEFLMTNSQQRNHGPTK